MSKIAIFKGLWIHLVVVLGFALFSILLFYPILQGKSLFQSDIVQYLGMAREQSDFREATSEEPFWVSNAFGGMPSFQLGAQYPDHWVKLIDLGIRFLPRPADYLFLYLLGFYGLLISLKISWRPSIIGALAFGLSTYLVIILGVGHNAKAHALGYFPWVFASVVWLFQKNKYWGGLLLALTLGLELAANHVQMTYYLMMLVGLALIFWGYQAIKSNQYKDFISRIFVFLIAVSASLAFNASSMLATAEYSSWSTRGASELTLDPDGMPKTAVQGLDYGYITEYSYGIFESFNLLVPRLKGGSNSEDLGTDSVFYPWLQENGLTPAQAMEWTQNLPLYWGDQPFVGAPAYLGIVVFVLFLLGLFTYRGVLKWPLVLGSVFALVLSWGDNSGIITRWMIDFFPLYNKFRAVTSIQVLLSFALPLLGVLGLKSWSALGSEEQQQAIIRVLWVLVSVFSIIGLGYFLSAFTSVGDATYQSYYGDEFVSLLQQDRKSAYLADMMRSLGFAVLTISLLFWGRKWSESVRYLLLGLLLIADLGSVAKRYVNSDDFVPAIQMKQPFSPSATDQLIQQDTTYFRVFDLDEGLNGSKNSFFHRSIGGYHAAKPRYIQEIFDYHLIKGVQEPLNMLNVKYVIQSDENGAPQVTRNAQANGPAWFVTQVQVAKDLDQVMQDLAVINTQNVALVDAKSGLKRQQWVADTLDQIQLVNNAPNHLEYQSQTKSERLAVFSEWYYQPGWNAYIDGENVPHYRVNYALRALIVPPGAHSISFKFEPQVVVMGSRIQIGVALIWLIFFFYLAFQWYKKTSDA